MAAAGVTRILLAALLFVAVAAPGICAERGERYAVTRPMVSFVFDDGNDTDLLLGKKVFADRGAVASTAVTTGFLNRPGYLSTSQLKELQAAGWEIMSHTRSHPNLASIPPDKVDEELAGSKADLEALGMTVSNIVYPYNKHDAGVRAVTARHYRSGRGGSSRLNGPQLDPFFIRSFSLKHDMERLKGLVDTAHAEKRWLVIYQHEINVKVKLSEYDGSFIKGEELELSPSGTVGRCVTTHWFPIYGHALFIAPLSGQPRPGDVVRGVSSKATARIDSIAYDEPQQLSELLGYIQSTYADMPIVTIDQGLDMLGVPQFPGSDSPRLPLKTDTVPSSSKGTATGYP